MEQPQINVKFVSQKISKIRWRPRLKQSLQPSNVFASGSWDDEVNKLCLWHQEGLGTGDERIRLQEDNFLQEPDLLCDVQHPGDVTDLCFLNQDQILTTSSTGSLILFRHHPNSQTLEVVQEWVELHHSGGRGCPCTCLAVYGEDVILTGGEDGCMNLVAPGQAKPVRVFQKADSCTINALTFLKQSEVLSVNSFGQLKLWDFRNRSDEPVQIFSATDEHWPLLCVDRHPGQHHILATGSQDGTLTVWDLRQTKFPMTTLDAHQTSMWEVRFHPSHAEHLFTCSEDGSVWHWDASALASSVLKASKGGDGGQQSPWLGLEASSKLEINSLICNKSLSVNTLDIEGSLLLCGTDSENIYSINMPHLV